MRDQDEVEQERMEAATETPAFIGCPKHMPTKLPGGFDGVEPGEKSKIEASITRMREKLSKIADIALAADAKCVNIEKLGVRYLECAKAVCEIRMMCGRDLAEELGAEDKAAKQKEYFRKHFSFCDGLLPIRFTNTEDGQMASCWINGRHFTLDLDNNERDDGWYGCAANIRDNGKVVITIETQRGKSISGKVAYGAFKEYIRNLSGSRKYSRRGGFLKQQAARAAKKEGGAK